MDLEREMSEFEKRKWEAEMTKWEAIFQDSGNIPSDWRLANVTPGFKKGISSAVSNEPQYLSHRRLAKHLSA